MVCVFEDEYRAGGLRVEQLRINAYSYQAVFQETIEEKNSLHPSFWRGQIYNRNIWKQTPRQRQRRTKGQRRGRHAN